MTSVLAGGTACAVLVVLAGLCIGRVMRALDSRAETERPWNLTEGVLQSATAASAGEAGSPPSADVDHVRPGEPVVHSAVQATSGAHLV